MKCQILGIRIRAHPFHKILKRTIEARNGPHPRQFGDRIWDNANVNFAWRSEQFRAPGIAHGYIVSCLKRGVDLAPPRGKALAGFGVQARARMTSDRADRRAHSAASRSAISSGALPALTGRPPPRASARGKLVLIPSSETDGRIDL